jgi:hypothetical protein
MAKADDAWAIIRKIMDEPAKDWDFPTEKDKSDWIAARYRELHSAQEKKTND